VYFYVLLVDQLLLIYFYNMLLLLVLFVVSGKIQGGPCRRIPPSLGAHGVAVLW